MKAATNAARFSREDDFSGLPAVEPSGLTLYAGAAAFLATVGLGALVVFLLVPYFYAWSLQYLMP